MDRATLPLRIRRNPADLVRSCLIVFGMAALFLFAWQVRHVLLLAFGSVVIAAILRALVRPVARLTRLGEGVAFGLSLLLLAGLIGGAGYLFGEQVAAQAGDLREQLPAALAVAQAQLAGAGLDDLADEAVAALPDAAVFVRHIGSMGLGLGSALLDLLIVVVGAIYLAAQPDLYRRGLLKLVAPARRPLAATAVDDSGRALQLWLKGQLFSMLLVGVLTGVGLWLIGVPSALALGILAALLEFIPFVGPIIAAVPALLIALIQGPEIALWTLLLYVGLQQAEGNLIQPLVQRYAVEIPPALLLLALLVAGASFGFTGILLAAPLAVVLFVLVKRLYVREALDTPTSIPGEEQA